MGVRITTESNVALYDSVSGFAFGPVFDSYERAERFLQYVELKTGGVDSRELTDDTLRHLAEEFSLISTEMR